VAVVRTWLRVTPGSSRPGVGGSYPRPGEPALQVRVRERAVDGRASRAALALVAEALGLSARDVRLDVGPRSRDKLVAIDTDDPSAVVERLRILRENR
jgi:uncharacterized protein YggU (UPF0235/DUF167 family)